MKNHSMRNCMAAWRSSTMTLNTLLLTSRHQNIYTSRTCQKRQQTNSQNLIQTQTTLSKCFTSAARENTEFWCCSIMTCWKQNTYPVFEIIARRIYVIILIHAAAQTADARGWTVTRSTVVIDVVTSQTFLWFSTCKNTNSVKTIITKFKWVCNVNNEYVGARYWIHAG